MPFSFRNLLNKLCKQSMIADLKADSERWEAERQSRTISLRGQSSNRMKAHDICCISQSPNILKAEYRTSMTHQSRQYYGPTTDTPLPVAYTRHSSGYRPERLGQVSRLESAALDNINSPYHSTGTDIEVDLNDSPTRVPVTQPVPLSNEDQSISTGSTSSTQLIDRYYDPPLPNSQYLSDAAYSYYESYDSRCMYYLKSSHSPICTHKQF